MPNTRCGTNAGNGSASTAGVVREVRAAEKWSPRVRLWPTKSGTKWWKNCSDPEKKSWVIGSGESGEQGKRQRATRRPWTIRRCGAAGPARGRCSVLAGKWSGT
eukprot:g8633.t1